MATITGLTAARMQEIEDASVVAGAIINGHLILTKHDGTTIDAGPVVGAAGPPGPTGPPGSSAIPGEVKLWANDVLPDPAQWGKWVWADGAAYDVATYPLAAGNISGSWKTFDGAADPGAGKFRVPDMRGLIPAGMDQMPTGVRANRMTRTAAIVLATRTGKEQHALIVGEMPSHSHTVNSHSHTVNAHSHGGSTQSETAYHQHTMGWNRTTTMNNSGAANGVTGLVNPASSPQFITFTDNESAPHAHAISAESPGTDAQAPGTNAQGSGNVHENVQPTVMVPYIVCLGG